MPESQLNKYKHVIARKILICVLFHFSEKNRQSHDFAKFFNQ